MASRKYDDVLVFGPTGTVGGITALEARNRGAKVWLAMRDPTKTIAEIPADVERSGNFARLQADLTNPASVAKAVQASGAKAAYIYLVYGADIKPSLQALREGGVEYVVFLSTLEIGDKVDLHEVPQTEFIAWSHAQVEIALEELGFPYVTALRPGMFASNYFKHWVDTAVTPPRIRIIRADILSDSIAPEDIGTVGGAVLAERPSDGKEVILQCGPQLRTLGDSLELIKKITGQDFDTRPSSRDEYLGSLANKGIPQFFAEVLANVYGGDRAVDALCPESIFVTAAAATKKYAGKEPVKFEEYLEKHKAEWQDL